jgi:hypothetical protein
MLIVQHMRELVPGMVLGGPCIGESGSGVIKNTTSMKQGVL